MVDGLRVDAAARAILNVVSDGARAGCAVLVRGSAASLPFVLAYGVFAKPRKAYGHIALQSGGRRIGAAVAAHAGVL